jgi:hypothetical protein
MPMMLSLNFDKENGKYILFWPLETAVTSKHLSVGAQTVHGVLKKLFISLDFKNFYQRCSESQV